MPPTLTDPRAVVHADFPVDGPPEARLRFLLPYAVLAPSVLNTQPWRFRIEGACLALYADRSRQLRALDPAGRELAVSCGAALLHLRVAARRFGLTTAAQVLPDPADEDLLAVLTLTGQRPPSDRDERLFRAIATRRTNRRPFAPTPVPRETVGALRLAARKEGARLVVLGREDARRAVAVLVAEGVRLQGADRRLTEELAAWLRSDSDPRRDGIPDAQQGAWDGRTDARVSSAVLARRREALVAASPVVLVLATEADTPAAWLAAGQALGRVLLVAADHGLLASYANQPVEVEALRPELAREVGGGSPQVVFRVGYPERREGTPRRPIEDVLL